MRVRFAEVTFDQDLRQIWRSGRAVHLSRKAFDLLGLLIERRPNTVSKSEIHHRLWPATFVSEANLPPLVAEVREAIGDDRRSPRYVRTVHGIGYALAATVRAVEDYSLASGGERTAMLVGDGLRVTLSVGINVLGRDGPDVIAVGSETISRRHARIVVGDDTMFVEDLGSKNGTYVNDVPASSPHPLVDGDQLRLGSRVFTFRVGAYADSTKTEPA